MHCDCSMQQPRQTLTALLEMQPKPLNMVSEGVMESVRVNGVTVLSGLNLEKIQGLSFPRDKPSAVNSPGLQIRV